MERSNGKKQTRLINFEISAYIANIINLFTWHAFTMVDRITSK